MIFFTSDTHFGHARVIEYCNRPFESLEEMNETMVWRWNERVKETDTVFHLGDFAMGQKDQLPYWRRRLSGHICLVPGNHDRSPKVMREAGFQVMKPVEIILVDRQNVALSHNPATVRGNPWLHLHGHVHGEYKYDGRKINVGVDQWDFTPRTLAELISGL